MSEISESVLNFNTLVLELNAQCECRNLNLSESYIRRPLNGHRLYLMFGVWVSCWGTDIPGVRHQMVVVECTSQGSIHCMTCEGGIDRLSADVTNQLPSFAM